VKIKCYKSPDIDLIQAKLLLTGSRSHSETHKLKTSILNKGRITSMENNYLLSQFIKWETKVTAVASNKSLICELHTKFQPIIFWHC